MLQEEECMDTDEYVSGGVNYHDHHICELSEVKMSFDIDEMLYIYGFAGSEINLCMNCLCSE